MSQVRQFKVYDLEQERWLIDSNACTCGGAWAVAGPQRLEVVDGVHCDCFEVRCNACDMTSEFKFDVSPVLGHREQTDAWINRVLPHADEMVRGQVTRKIGPPLMTKVNSFIAGLTADRDVATLQYLLFRVQTALNIARDD